jgi:hypothetical protein
MIGKCKRYIVCGVASGFHVMVEELRTDSVWCGGSEQWYENNGTSNEREVYKFIAGGEAGNTDCALGTPQRTCHNTLAILTKNIISFNR